MLSINVQAARSSLSLSPSLSLSRVWPEHPPEPHDSTRYRQYGLTTYLYVRKCTRQYDTGTLNEEFGNTEGLPFRQRFFMRDWRLSFVRFTEESLKGYRPAVSLTAVVDAAGILVVHKRSLLSHLTSARLFPFSSSPYL